MASNNLGFLSVEELFGPDGNVPTFDPHASMAPAFNSYSVPKAVPVVQKMTAVDTKTYFEMNRQPIYVNFGGGSILIDLSSLVPGDLAFSIRKIAGDYIRDNHFVNSKLLIRRSHVTVRADTGYSAYLAQINSDDLAYQWPGIQTIGVRSSNTIPVFIFGKEKPIVVCGCCGELLSDFSGAVARHVEKKNVVHEQWAKNKYTACHLCDYFADNTQDCVEHFFGHNHATRMNRCITGVTEASTNDLRLFKGYALPFISTIQAQMAYYVNKAPVAILMSIHRTTQIERANTQELPMALAIELNSSPMDNVWIPDCPICDDRYFKYNTVHYCSIGALQDVCSFKMRNCGHYLPEFTAADMDLFDRITILCLIKKKINKEKTFYGCGAYSTASRKDDFDDEDGYNDKYRYYMAKYGGVAKTTHADTNVNHRSYYAGPGSLLLSQYNGRSFHYTNYGHMSMTRVLAEDYADPVPIYMPTQEKQVQLVPRINVPIHMPIIKPCKNAIFSIEMRNNVNHKISHLIRRWNNYYTKNKHKQGGVYLDSRHRLDPFIRGAYYYSGPVVWNSIGYDLDDEPPTIARAILREYQTSLCVK